MCALNFNPKQFSKEALTLIMLKAEEWRCSNAEAAVRLLNEVAKLQANKKGAA